MMVIEILKFEVVSKLRKIFKEHHYLCLQIKCTAVSGSNLNNLNQADFYSFQRMAVHILYFFSTKKKIEMFGFQGVFQK